MSQFFEEQREFEELLSRIVPSRVGLDPAAVFYRAGWEAAMCQRKSQLSKVGALQPFFGGLTIGLAASLLIAFHGPSLIFDRNRIDAVAAVESRADSARLFDVRPVQNAEGPDNSGARAPVAEPATEISEVDRTSLATDAANRPFLRRADWSDMNATLGRLDQHGGFVSIANQGGCDRPMGIAHFLRQQWGLNNVEDLNRPIRSEVKVESWNQARSALKPLWRRGNTDVAVWKAEGLL